MSIYIYIYIYINLLKTKLLVHIENAHYSEIPKSLKKILQHSAALKMLQQKKKIIIIIFPNNFTILNLKICTETCPPNCESEVN